ncbi:PhzF family phenazine biosynthesis protein [Mesorhizobium sp. AD1-1]|uniref:PhzF family phenazine biosynthesis protein n=1 Tax=Mesorhizobium sp. AD1-1 TaxID=2876621 RepID=UPI001CCD82F5|nr:PhzF family phenazine biosynthesis protein [Mesorhizobium sp. AD1-1]MBZ9719205.1 PhzF family phenazine biosynthesis protein [Mesorhizobium sp. AD1-1]
MTRPYFILDVFTDSPLAGNPLAVVLDAEDLGNSAMQAIAKEFNLSETIFLTGRLGGKVPVRIFTPTAEIPFAGHPTIGAAVLICSLLKDGGEELRMLTLDEKVGPVHCQALARSIGTGHAAFDIPDLPQQSPIDVQPAGLASLLSLSERDIGFESHVPSIFSSGFAFVFVPLSGLPALSAIRLDGGRWGEVLPEPMPRALVAYTNGPDGSYRLRVFAPALGVAEDPATGSAAAAFSGVLARFASLPDGEHAVRLLQGYEMGRPSQLDLQLTITNGGVCAARVGGSVVLVAAGTLRV